MENYHVLDLVGEGSFGKVEYDHGWKLTILAVLGLHAFHAMTLCRSTRGAASTQARSQP